LHHYLHTTTVAQKASKPQNPHKNPKKSLNPESKMYEEEFGKGTHYFVSKYHGMFGDLLECLSF